MFKPQAHKRYGSPKHDYDSQKAQVLLFLVLTVPLGSAGLFLNAMLFFELSPLEALWVPLVYLALLGGFAFLNRKRSGVVLVILDFLRRRRLSKSGTKELPD